tara:strand:- start:98 stop:424 length:327 start_codon:yes stop_codon:yes gene_type:complete
VNIIIRGLNKMGLQFDLTIKRKDCYNYTLPDDFDLIENEILEDCDLPKNWNSKKFTILDLSKQSQDYIKNVEDMIGYHLEAGNGAFNDYENAYDSYFEFITSDFKEVK